MKYMDIKEFVDKGYLHEVNRRFLHPLGLALAVSNDPDPEDSSPFGHSYKLHGIQDVRDDPEGMVFTELDVKKMDFIDAEWNQRRRVRLGLLGEMIQTKDYP